MNTKTLRWLVALLILSVACGLLLSGSATMKWAGDSHVPPGLTPFTVGMLELTTVVGTILWILARGFLRAQAIVTVVGSAFVTLLAGVHSYGPLGAVAPVGSVLVIHLVAAAWKQVRRAAGQDADDSAGQQEPPPVPAVIPAAAAPQDDPAPSQEDTGPPTQPMPRPVPAPPAEPISATKSEDEEILAILRSEGSSPSISEIKRRFRAGSGKATRIHQALNAA